MNKLIKTAIFGTWAFYLSSIPFIYLLNSINGKNWAGYLFWLLCLFILSISIAFLLKAIINTNEAKNNGISFHIPFAIIIFVSLIITAINIDTITSLTFDKFQYIWQSFFVLSESISITSFFFIISYVLGEKIFRHFRIEKITEAEMAVISVGLGSGVLIYIIYLLSILKIAYPSVIYILFLLIILNSIPKLINLFHQSVAIKKFSIPLEWGLNKTLTLTLVVLILSLAFINSLGNISNSHIYDTLTWYLSAPINYLGNQGLIEFPFHPSWGIPQGGEMIYFLGLLLGGINIAYIMNFIFLILSIVVFYLILKAAKLKNTLWISSIYISMPVFLAFLGGYLKVDSILCFFVLIIFLLVYKWLSDKNENIIPILAIFCGLAVIVKFIALFFVGGVFLSVLLLQKQFSFLNYRKIFTISLIIIALFLPWGIKNWIYYQQPLYPFIKGNDIFTQKINVSCIPHLNQNISEDRLFTLNTIPHTIPPKNESRLLSNIILTSKLFWTQQGIYIGNPGPWFLILLPAVAYYILKRKRDLFIAVTGASTIIYFIFWLVFLSGQIWYLLPSLIGFFIIAGFVLGENMNLNIYSPIRYIVPIWLFFVLFTFFITSDINEKVLYIRGEHDYQKTLDLIAKENGSDYADSYNMWQYINANILAKSNHKIIYGLLEGRQYFAIEPNKNFIPDLSGYLSSCLAQHGNILDDLKKLNVGYVIDNNNFIFQCSQNEKMDGYNICQARKSFDQLLDKHGKLIHREGTVKLYSIQ